MKLRYLGVFALSALSLALASCSHSSTSDPNANNGASSTSSGSTSSGGGATGSSGSSGASGASGSTGTSNGSSTCPTNPSRPYYEYYETGTGSGTVTTVWNDIVADQKLRVAIRPSASGTNSGQSNTLSYGSMALDVRLQRNGVTLATKHLPQPSTVSLGGGTYNAGVPTDQQTDPSLLDFSGSLGGGGNYEIQVANVKTDYKCKNYCTTNYYNCGYPLNYCYYYTAWGYTWNYDYNSGYYLCCDSNLLQLCQQTQCGVGPSISTATWSMYIRAETDSTTCIPQ